MLRGHFHFRHIFFLMVFKYIFFLKWQQKQNAFCQHFFLRVSRLFMGSNLLNLAGCLYSECITACFICLLSFQAYSSLVGGMTLGAFQSIIIKRRKITEHFYVQLLFWCLCFSWFVFLSGKFDNGFLLYFPGMLYLSPVFNYSPVSPPGLPCSIHSLWKGFQVLKVHFRKIS